MEQQGTAVNFNFKLIIVTLVFCVLLHFVFLLLELGLDINAIELVFYGTSGLTKT